MPKKSTNQFISEAKSIHGDWYDYSKTDYQGAGTKVTITCPVHGDFYQSPGSHIAGYKCRKCGLNQQSQSSRMTFDDFLVKANDRHNGFYGYDESSWTKSTGDVSVICPHHGTFKVQAFSHYTTGLGCPKCSKRPSVDTQIFIERARKKCYPNHDYSRTIYESSGKKLTITCTIHGDYRQIAFDHYRYPGCQKCRYIKSAKTRSRDRSKTSLDGYGAQVKRFTTASYKSHLSLINPLGLIRAKGLYELDHIYSIREGYENKVPPEIIGHYTNLRMLIGSENTSKHSRCDKTLEELYRDFRQATASDPQG